MVTKTFTYYDDDDDAWSGVEWSTHSSYIFILLSNLKNKTKSCITDCLPKFSLLSNHIA